jgi:S-DNA-T family DNA segregation ATPase FtsK/SpoIIIE
VVQALAAKGRAFGLHIFVSTQRPDAKVVDMNIKANLDGRICFYMADNAASMTILDGVRAADLPKVKGRAILRFGADLLEIQVPLLTTEKLESILAPLKKKNQTSENRPSDSDMKPSSNKNAIVNKG